MTFQSKAVVAAGVMALAAGWAASASAQATRPLSPDPILHIRKDIPGGPQPEGAPAGWGTLYSEWNLPKSVYVPGDPFLLDSSTKNMPGKRINFVACPIMMDSLPTPLWLTEYEGERYFLRAQQNSSGTVRHPQLLHKVLVQGIISNEPRIGGGVVLNPVKVSVVKEIDQNCTKMLPAQPGVGVKFAKKPPGPGASAVFRFASFAEDRKPPPPSVGPVARVDKTFTMYFDFDDDYLKEALGKRNAPGGKPAIPEAIHYAREMKPAKIEIHSFRGSALLTNGQVMVEDEYVAGRRASNVRAWLAEVQDIPQDIISVHVHNTPAKPDGISDFDGWRTEIRVLAGNGPPKQQTASR